MINPSINHDVKKPGKLHKHLHQADLNHNKSLPVVVRSLSPTANDSGGINGAVELHRVRSLVLQQVNPHPPRPQMFKSSLKMDKCRL